jgi:hypothetical protein
MGMSAKWHRLVVAPAIREPEARPPPATPPAIAMQGARPAAGFGMRGMRARYPRSRINSLASPPQQAAETAHILRYLVEPYCSGITYGGAGRAGALLMQVL